MQGMNHQSIIIKNHEYRLLREQFGDYSPCEDPIDKNIKTNRNRTKNVLSEQLILKFR